MYFRWCRYHEKEEMSVDDMNNNRVLAVPAVSQGNLDDFEASKRLSFGEISRQLNEKQRIDPNDVIHVLKDPTAERFVRYEVVGFTISL